MPQTPLPTPAVRRRSVCAANARAANHDRQSDAAPHTGAHTAAHTSSDVCSGHWCRLLCVGVECRDLCRPPTGAPTPAPTPHVAANITCAECFLVNGTWAPGSIGSFQWCKCCQFDCRANFQTSCLAAGFCGTQCTRTSNYCANVALPPSSGVTLSRSGTGSLRESSNSAATSAEHTGSAAVQATDSLAWHATEYSGLPLLHWLLIGFGGLCCLGSALATVSAVFCNNGDRRRRRKRRGY